MLCVQPAGYSHLSLLAKGCSVTVICNLHLYCHNGAVLSHTGAMSPIYQCEESAGKVVQCSSRHVGLVRVHKRCRWQPGRGSWRLGLSQCWSKMLLSAPSRWSFAWKLGHWCWTLIGPIPGGGAIHAVPPLARPGRSSCRSRDPCSSLSAEQRIRKRCRWMTSASWMAMLGKPKMPEIVLQSPGSRCRLSECKTAW